MGTGGVVGIGGGGESAGGTTATGGNATGGTPSMGGSATGGSANGGTSSGQGGSATGGSNGGTATGGTATGGTATGGTATGGTATGGTATGGAGAGGRGGAGAGGAGAGGAGAGGAGAGGRGGTSAGGAGSGGTATAGAGMGGGGPVVELAQGRTATADSEENSPTSNPPKVNLAPNANDGSATTRWCAANGGQHYWTVDLGASHVLTRVEIDFEYPTQAAGAAYGYLVGVSPDGSTFTTAINGSANTSTTMTQSAMFPASTQGRYVRITVIPPTTTPNPTWSSFWEARVYGR
jgi:hypothetical protein